MIFVGWDVLSFKCAVSDGLALVQCELSGVGGLAYQGNKSRLAGSDSSGCMVDGLITYSPIAFPKLFILSLLIAEHSYDV